ncbi:aldehyde dehydrogenase family 3 member F1-like [Hordeum vulgare subsp. vulgare]|uniref:Aldehyde dehydrogenase n=1 Tax=Hordeum vulgare subsp. vulgare TaxID=112509 RepID=A0A8I6YKE5_HORVV|nr:aldehyde dehydrogenase family 3 member F1-like [Hordeum vulgare subsp. vulgare]
METVQEKPALGLGSLVSSLRVVYKSGRTKELAWRQSQLKGLIRLLTEKEEEIFDVLRDDLGKHRTESFRDEVGVLVKSIKYTLQNLEKWAVPEKAPTPLVSFPATALVLPEPLGVVLIFSCWNFPLVLALEPLSGALAAGNAVVVKPSELAPSSAAFLAANIPRYLDAEAVKVVPGAPEVGQELMEHRWDKVLFTGGARVGRIIMTKAAKHLTPVALELGSKCPCIVDWLDSRRDSQVAVNRIIGGKWSTCAGQACIAIDYILVEEQFAPILIELLKSTLERFFTKPEDMARIVNERQFNRLSGLLEDHKVSCSIVHGGDLDPKTLSIEPTILLNPPLDSDVMTEEIFGPLLPIITVKKIEDSIEFVNSRPKPLAIYAFTTSEALKQQIIKETSSGSVTFNDAIVQYGLESIPFGGVGQSGFGQYHGKYSFEMFSHKKAVFRRSFLVEFMFRYPPWNDESKLGLLRHVFRYDYVSLVLALLGLRR